MEKLWVHIVLATSACLTNSFFILLVGTKSRLKTCTNLILLSMAVADLFIGLFVTPLLGVFSSLTIVIKNVYICACIHSVLLYFIIVSLCHVVLVAVERYLSFVYPLRYPVIFTHGRLRKSLLVCWILPLVITISPALGWYNNGIPINANWTAEELENFTAMEISRCAVEHVTACSYTYLISGIVVLVFCALTYFHIRIAFVACRQIRKHRSRTTNLAKGHRAGWSSFKQETRAFFMVMFVVDYFLVSWSPVGALVFVGCIFEHSVIPKWMFKVFPLLAMSNSAFNPIVYGLAKRDIRKYVFGKLFKRPVSKKPYMLANSGYSRRDGRSSSSSSTEKLRT